MSAEDFQHLRDLILETFPKENVINVYIEDPQSKSKPRGRLYAAYSSWRLELINDKMIEPARRSKGARRIEEGSINLEAQDLHDSLMTTITPWEKVQRLWDATFAQRMTQLKACSTFEAYFQLYPCLKDERSRSLLLNDGNKKMAAIGWNNTFSFEKILQNYEMVFMKGILFVPLRFLETYQLIMDERVRKEVRSLLAISFLPFCLAKVPGKRKRSHGDDQVDNLEQSPRAENFFGFLPIFNNLEEIKTFSKAKKRNVFPFGYLIFNKDDTTLMLVIQVNDFWWIYNNPVEGFDAFFKIFYALDVKFNPDSKSLFWIIQNLIYGLHSKESDKKNGNVTALGLLNVLQTSRSLTSQSLNSQSQT